MKKYSILLSLCIILLMLGAKPVPAESINENAGTCSAQFLKISVGARPAAMGEAYTAVSDDSFGIFANPAGSYAMKKIDAGVMRNSWISGINQDVAAISLPSKSSCTVSLGTVFINMPRLQGSDVYGNDTDTFVAYSMMTMLSYSFKFFSNEWSCGINAKYIEESIENERAVGSCWDVGLMYKPLESNFIFGAVAQNIGKEMKFVQEAFAIPRTIKAGISRKFYEGKVLASFEAGKATDENTKYCAGFEYNGLKYITPRIGWLARGSISAGAGFKHDPFYFDYAFLPVDELGYTHRFSLRILFDMPQRLAKQKKQPLPEPISIIKGTVTDSSGLPLEGAVVRVSLNFKEKARVMTDSSGAFKTTPLPDGTYDIKAWKYRYEPVSKTIDVVFNMNTEVDFEIDRVKAIPHIYGNVTSKTGQPFRGIVIKVSQKGVEKMRVLTDENGNYETPELPTGTYEVKAWSKSGDLSTTKKCKIESRLPVQMDFSLNNIR